jgi:hypothetical protein
MSEPLTQVTEVGDRNGQQPEQRVEWARSISQGIRAFENTRTRRVLENLFYEASTPAWRFC